MSQMEVMINGRNYAIACDEGQEEHIGRLAGYVKVRVEELVESVGQIGDARLLLMASLLVSDELSDAYAELATVQSETSSDEKTQDEISAEKLERLAAQAEAIAERLEAS